MFKLKVQQERFWAEKYRSFRSSRPFFNWALNPNDVRFFATNGYRFPRNPRIVCSFCIGYVRTYKNLPLKSENGKEQSVYYIITVHFKSFNRDLPEKKETQSAFTLYRIFASQNSGSNANETSVMRPTVRHVAGRMCLFHPNDHRVLVSEGNSGNDLFFNYPSWISLYFTHHW